MAEPKTITLILATFVGVIILTTIIGALITEVNNAGDQLSGTGAPLSGLFAANNVVTLIVVGILIFSVIGLLLLPLLKQKME